MSKVKGKLVSLFAFAAMAVVAIGCESGGKIDANAVGKWKSGSSFTVFELTSDGKMMSDGTDYCKMIEDIGKAFKIDIKKCNYKITSNTITFTGSRNNEEYKEEYSYSVDGDVMTITATAESSDKGMEGKWNRVK